MFYSSNASKIYFICLSTDALSVWVIHTREQKTIYVFLATLIRSCPNVVMLIFLCVFLQMITTRNLMKQLVTRQCGSELQ